MTCPIDQDDLALLALDLVSAGRQELRDEAQPQEVLGQGAAEVGTLPLSGLDLQAVDEPLGHQSLGDLVVSHRGSPAVPSAGLPARLTGVGHDGLADPFKEIEHDKVV